MSLDNIDGQPLSGNVPVSSGAPYASPHSSVERGDPSTVAPAAAQEHPGVAFLLALDPEGRHNLVWVDEHGHWYGETLEPGDRKGLDACIKAHDGRHSVYYSVNEPAPGAPHRKLRKDHIVSIRAVCADHDLKPHEPLDTGKLRLTAHAADVNARLPATYTIDSGGGVQFLWCLAEKLDASAGQVWAEPQGRGLAAMVKGDAVIDISRIMRLPFTQNIPTEKKRSWGRVQTEARLIGERGPVYTKELIARAVAPIPGGHSAVTTGAIADAAAEMDLAAAVECSDLDALPGDLSERLTTARAGDRFLDDLLRIGAHAKVEGDVSPSGLRASLVARLKMHRFSAHDYACVVHAWPLGWPSALGLDGLTDRVLSRDWGNCGIDVLKPFDVNRWFDEVAATAAENTEAEAQKTKGLAWVDPSGWQDRQVTPPEWLVENWIPHKQVTLLYGDGGVGKTLIAQQLATAIAAGRNWLGLPTRRARVMCFLCEDSEDELHRRQIAINRALEVDFADLSNLRIVSRVSGDNILARFERDGKMVFREVYNQLLADAQAFRADLIIVDTLADIFGGNEIDRAQVSAFVKQGLGGLARAIDGSVIALGHPSQSGMTSGKGTSGSGAWNNAARSRLYLTDLGGNFRELENKKLNYGPAGSKLKLEWRAGALHAIAGTMMGEVSAGTTFIPQLDDAAENAVIQSVAACHGMRMTDATTTRYAAPKVLREAQPELLKAFTPQEIEDAFRRLLTTGTIRSVPIGRDKSSRPISGFAVVTDNLSAPAAADDDIFA